MQYWIFYWGGVGGDGFSNFLEHADNVEPADGELKWRTSPLEWNPTYQGVGDVKFTSPDWCSDVRFFRDHNDGLDPNTVTLNPHYVNLVKTGTNTSIPIHPWWYRQTIKDHPLSDILTKDIHKIFLYSDNIDRVINDFCNKTNTTPEIKADVFYYYSHHKDGQMRSMLRPTGREIPLAFYDTLIDIERVWRDWDYTSKTLSDIGINMSRDMYEEYLTVSNRRYT